MKLKAGQIIPNEELQKIHAAALGLKGTPQYMKYNMELDYYRNGSWVFLCHSVPITLLDAKIQKYKDNVYLVFENGRLGTASSDKERYRLTPAVMELMGWEI